MSVGPSTRRAALAERLLSSARSRGVVSRGLDDYWTTLASDSQRIYTRTTRLPLSELRDWHAVPGTEVIRHRNAHFFTVEGVTVTSAAGEWDQPIIVQPEVGLLGIIAREFNGVLHFLMQNKAEPGNRNGIQLSPTVQATRSNFTQAHGGDSVPYLHYFLDPAQADATVLADVRQSEHGGTFLWKRNRNVIIEVFDDVPTAPGFTWLTLGQIAELMQVDDLANMDTRSVLACLPYAGDCRVAPTPIAAEDDSFQAALWRSYHADERCSLLPSGIASWITKTRSKHRSQVRPAALHRLAGWRFGPDRISSVDSESFTIVGVSVEACGREVRRWDQPMITVDESGLVALIVRRRDGLLHALVQLLDEPGNADGAEIAPTVQVGPTTRAGGHTGPRSSLRERVLAAEPADTRYDTMLSDEGGRFLGVSHRHLVVECDDVEAPPGFRWVTLHDLGLLIQHTHYLNVHTRSILACLQSRLARDPKGGYA